MRTHLSVNDNGTGINLEKLEDINHTIEYRSATDGLDGDSVSGIGLANVHNRIRMIFGEPYGIRMTSELEGGTTVSLTIPVRGEGHV